MKTRIIGLTGGIGSGKSTIAAYYALLGIPVYIADEEAKKMLNTHGVVKELVSAFGEEILTDEQPDRSKLSAIVFNDRQKLDTLNGIIHPKVREHFKQWVEAHAGNPFVIKEAAILFESGSYKECDAVILVTAPKEVRIQRVMERDKVSREQVLARMAAQWEEERKIVLSDYIINNTDLTQAKAEAVKILKIIEK